MRETTSGEEATAHDPSCALSFPGSGGVTILSYARTNITATTAGLLVLLSGPVRAEDGDGAGSGDRSVEAPIVVAPIDVRTEREEDDAAERALDEPAFITVVRTGDHAGETTTVAEILADSVGVHVRSLGGLGAFSSLSIRGADSGHTAVLVDGVPLSRIASATVDLGLHDLRSFSELELYRGGVPVHLGGAGVGGALNLITRVGAPADGRPLALSAGFGSFGARHLRGRFTDGEGDRGLHLAIGYAGADGDFPFFDDNGTSLEPGDDTVSTRTNNGYDRVDASGRWRHGGLTAGLRSVWKQQGVPGTGNNQSQAASLTTVLPIADLAFERPRAFGIPTLSARASAYAAVEHQRFRDLAGEVGLGQRDLRNLTATAGGTTGVRWAAGDAHLISLGLDFRLDYFFARDLMGESGMDTMASGGRAGLGLVAADEIILGEDDAVVLAPAVRLDVHRTEPLADSDSPITGYMDLEGRTDLYPSPRLAARVRVTGGLAVKGSAGRYFRAPTVVELFGDRGFIVGSGDLRPETGLTADLGLVWAPARALGRVDRVYVEAVGFASRPRDAIVFVPLAGLVARPRNIDGARLAGAEVAGSMRLAEALTLSGNYTYLYTGQVSTQPSHDGKRLPHRPAHELYGRADLARRVAGRMTALWTDAAYVAGNYLDLSNLSRVPERLLLGAGLKVEPVAGLLVGLEVKNATDARVETIPLDPPPRPDLTETPRAISDFHGYPLPGRAFYATVEWTH